jgi:hypothetical protein
LFVSGNCKQFVKGWTGPKKTYAVIAAPILTAGDFVDRDDDRDGEGGVIFDTRQAGLRTRRTANCLTTVSKYRHAVGRRDCAPTRMFL